MSLTVEKPFPIHRLATLWRWIEEFGHIFKDDYFAQDLDAFVDWWIQFERAGQTSWVVRVDGDLAGCVTSKPIGPDVRDVHCIFPREYWGRDITMESLIRVMDELFNSGTEKVSTMTFGGNRSLSSLVRELGGTKEGNLIGHMKKGGQRIDVMLYGCLKGRFYELWGEHAKRFNGSTDTPVESVQSEHEHERNVKHDRNQHGEHGRNHGGQHDAHAQPAAASR